jgi:hypothetical protein
MKSVICAVVALAMVGVYAPVFADPGKDESGHGRKYESRRHKGGEYKEEYWDGDCKVERKWKKNGDFKEERKCEGPRSNAQRYTPADPPASSRGSAVVVRPPSVVIEAPSLIVKPPSIKIK